MLFANRRGILTFDGQNWNSIPIPAIPYSLKYNAQERKVYVGGENNYGYLQGMIKGSYRYFSISGDSSSLINNKDPFILILLYISTVNKALAGTI